MTINQQSQKFAYDWINLQNVVYYDNCKSKVK